MWKIQNIVKQLAQFGDLKFILIFISFVPNIHEIHFIMAYHYNRNPQNPIFLLVIVCMSIALIDKNTQLTKQIQAGSQFLSASILRKLASVQLDCPLSQLKIFHFGTERQYGQNEVVRQGQKVQFTLSTKIQSLSVVPKRKGIVYPDELEKIIQTAKIIVIKSANEENIQKSKQHSLWATTFSNQERLKYFFNTFPHVLLIFATNRSFQIKGLARMESEPDKITDKTVWSGVSNIRLGGNFKIKWLRKKPLSLALIQKSIGSNFKEIIIKSCDGQQLDPNSCKKLAYIFEVPEQPYYLQEERLQKSNFKEQNTKSTINLSLPISNIPPFSMQLFFPQIPFTHPSQSSQFNSMMPQKNIQKKSQRSSSSSLSSKSSKKKKIKKKHKKKDKKQKKNSKSHIKNNKKRSGLSSDWSDQSSDQSEQSQSRERRHKKGKKQKSKHKKRRH